MYELLGICLALAAFFALHGAASLAAALAWKVVRNSVGRWSARSRAEFMFALRIAPAALALAAVGLLFLPAYINYEPRGTSEVVSVKLAAFAAVSGFGLAFALWRGARALSATRALRKSWLKQSQEVVLPGISVRTFRIDHSFPLIAVIGTIRPRLFIAERVLASLSAEELAAAIAHEHGHLQACDNLKRALLRACRDALILPFGDALNQAWAETAEAAADEHAAQSSPKVALNLASALVRIARMVPQGTRAETPLAVFLVGDETRGIKSRVRHLLEMASANQVGRVTNFEFSRVVPVAALTLTLVIGATLAMNAQVLLSVHLLVERVVTLLS